MKKLLSLLLVCSLLAILAIGAGANYAQMNEGTVPTTTAAINIDGVMDDAYATAFTMNINQPQYANYNYADGLDPTGRAYLLVSNDYSTLYVYAIVWDIDMSELEEERPWYTDGFEVFIDPTNASTMVEAAVPADEDATLAQGGVQLQYRQNLSGRKTSSYRINTTGAYEEAAPEALNDLFTSATGDASWNEYYEVEFAIDLKAYATTQFGGVTCGAGTQLGIQLMINDTRAVASTFCGNILNENSVVPLNFHKDDNPWVWRADEWNYIVLGEPGYVPPTPPAPMDGDKPAAPTQPPKTADGMLFAALALIASAGCAVAVLKKRK